MGRTKQKDVPGRKKTVLTQAPLLLKNPTRGVPVARPEKTKFTSTALPFLARSLEAAGWDGIAASLVESPVCKRIQTSQPEVQPKHYTLTSKK